MDVLLRLRYMRKYYFYEKDSIIVSSIPKSGTHYILFLLANYLRIHFEGADAPVTPKMLDELFPNTLRNKPVAAHGQSLARKAGAADIIWGHHYKYLRVSSARKIIFLYRNPLDQIVSNYFYATRLKTMEQTDALYGKSMEDAVAILAHRYGRDYSFHKRNLLGRQAMPLSYEILMQDKWNIAYTLLNWLGWPVNKAHLDTSLHFSDKRTIKALELKHSTPVANAKESFIRDGSCGGWKQHLNDAHVAAVVSILAGYGITMDEFITE